MRLTLFQITRSARQVLPRRLLAAVPERLLRDAATWAFKHAPPDSADRVCLLERLLPYLASAHPERVLFVGCRWYTVAYARYFSAAEYWTADIDPSASIWGQRGRHICADVGTIDRAVPPGSFDIVILNGVLGWGVDSPEAMTRAIEAIARIVGHAGLLLIGWNKDRCVDPLGLLPTMNLFAPYDKAGFGARMTFPQSTHVFDLLERRSPGGASSRREPSAAPIGCSSCPAPPVSTAIDPVKRGGILSA